MPNGTLYGDYLLYEDAALGPLSLAYYRTINQTTTYLSLSGTAANYQIWDNASIKPVTAPSTDGIIIVNAKGGSTENFLTKDSGFVHNAASYTVIVKKLRG
jgi:hypothetical protein